MDEPAISEVSCSIGFGPEEGGQSVEITYTLHKVVDPGPEFEARAQQFGILKKIDGIGEQAFFDDMEEEGAGSGSSTARPSSRSTSSARTTR